MEIQEESGNLFCSYIFSSGTMTIRALIISDRHIKISIQIHLQMFVDYILPSTCQIGKRMLNRPIRRMSSSTNTTHHLRLAIICLLYTLSKRLSQQSAPTLKSTFNGYNETILSTSHIKFLERLDFSIQCLQRIIKKICIIGILYKKGKLQYSKSINKQDFHRRMPIREEK